MPRINEARVLILATDGYERSELRQPHDELKAKGARVDIAAPKAGPIRSWDKTDWGDSIDATLAAREANAKEYDALVIPGGQINPDKLRIDKDALQVVKDFLASGKVVAAICHGPWLLVEADALRGRKATSYQSIRTDLKNAGADWRDEAVVTDAGIITSRKPEDLPAFIAKIVEEIEEGKHHQRAA